MSTVPSPSLKPYRGRSWKRLRRIDIVARLEAMFISDQEIANHLGLTVGAIQAIKSTPEFLAKRITLQTGVLSHYDNALMSDVDKQESIKELSTLALHNAKRILLDKSDPNHGKAVFEILDRDKATSKISRQEHSVAQTRDLSKQNDSAMELLKMLGAPVEPQLPPTPAKVVLESITMNVPGPEPEDESTIDLDPDELSVTYEPVKVVN
jgi:hypothetical protein